MSEREPALSDEAPPTPFRTLVHRAPRLSSLARLYSLGGAVLLSLLLTFLVFVIWSWWLSWLPAEDEDGPIPVLLAP